MMRLFDLFDLRDKSGRVSHKKLLPLVLFFAAIVFQALHNQFSADVLLILGAIAFGPRMYGLVVDARREAARAALAAADSLTEPAPQPPPGWQPRPMPDVEWVPAAGMKQDGAP